MIKRTQQKIKEKSSTELVAKLAKAKKAYEYTVKNCKSFYKTNVEDLYEKATEIKIRSKVLKEKNLDMKLKYMRKLTRSNHSKKMFGMIMGFEKTKKKNY